MGYNSLYGTNPATEGPSNRPLPHCIRVWTWLVLCEDNTVISINENPFPHSHDPLDAVQQLILTEIRRNIVDIFRSLSVTSEPYLAARAPMAVLPIRSS